MEICNTRNFCKFACKFHGVSHACLQREQRDKPYAVTRVCRAEPLLQPCACRVAVRSARGIVLPCRARVWSAQTDSQRLAAGREGRKGAFRGTCARSAGEHVPDAPCCTCSNVRMGWAARAISSLRFQADAPREGSKGAGALTRTTVWRTASRRAAAARRRDSVQCQAGAPGVKAD